MDAHVRLREPMYRFPHADEEQGSYILVPNDWRPVPFFDIPVLCPCHFQGVCPECLPSWEQCYEVSLGEPPDLPARVEHEHG